MSLLQALLHPDQEERVSKDRALVASAANLLDVGEFQLLQLAYWEWYGTNIPEASFRGLFHSFMVCNVVPHWARYYARTILERGERGEIDNTAPAYHRFDGDIASPKLNSVWRFRLTVASLVIVLGGTFGGILMMVEGMVGDPTSVRPTYLESGESRGPEVKLTWDRRDKLSAFAGPTVRGDPPKR